MSSAAPRATDATDATDARENEHRGDKHETVSRPKDPREGWRYALQIFAAFATLLVVVGLISFFFKPQLTAFARSFVARFGYAGLFVGTFVADTFHVPLPAQFYMLTSI